MKNDYIKLIRTLIILMIVLIVCICIIFISFNSSKSNKGDKKNQYKDEDITVEYQNEGKYKPSVINSDYTLMNNEEIKILDDNIDSIIDKINARDYEELFYMVPTDHKKIKFNTFEKFKNYIDSVFKGKNYKCVSFRIDDYNCYLNLQAEEESGNQNTIDLKIVGFKQKDSARIHFENINYIEPTETYFTVSKVAFYMQYLVEYDDKMSVFFNINNKSETTKDINIQEIKLIRVVNGQEEIVSSIDGANVTVKSQEKTGLEIYMDTEDNLMYLPDSLVIKMKVNGEFKQYRFAVVYPTFE